MCYGGYNGGAAVYCSGADKYVFYARCDCHNVIIQIAHSVPLRLSTPRATGGVALEPAILAAISTSGTVPLMLLPVARASNRQDNSS